MESGDIIYFILLVFFMILGFFNDSRKKKNQEKQAAKGASSSHESVDKPLPPNPPNPPNPFLIPSDHSRKERKEVFQSSMKQTADYRKYDSGDSIVFDYNMNAFDEVDSGLSIADRPMDPEAPEIPIESRARRTSDGKNRGGDHPIVTELHGDNAAQAFRKAVIYSEIIPRRY